MKAPELFSPSDSCFVGKYRVTGVYQTGRRRSIRDETEINDEMTLLREYGNKFDERAVAVYDRYNRKIGYIEKRVNEEPAFYLDSGYECVATVSDIDKRSATVGIMVDVFCIADAGDMQRLKAEFEEYLRETIYDRDV